MLSFSTGRRGPVGLDLGGRWVKAVQLARGGHGRWRVAAAAAIPRPAPGAPVDRRFAARLREAMYRQGFGGAKIVATAPAAAYHAEVLDLPPRSSGAPIDVIARAELARCAKYDGVGFEMAHWDLPAPARGGSGTAVMAVAMPHATADPLLDALEDAGIVIDTLDLPARALARAVGGYSTGPETRPGGRATAVLDIGWTAALLVLVRDGVVLYQRAIPEGGAGLLYREVMDRFALTEDVAGYMLSPSSPKPAGEDSARSSWVNDLAARHADALAQEVLASLAYTVHRYPDAAADTLLLTGGGAELAGMSRLLKARLDLDVAPIGAADLVDCPPGLSAGAGAAMVAAVGLAMTGGAGA